MSELVGTRIHHYRLQRLLGQGGMSEVYLAFDTLLQRKVAIKLVEKNLSEYFARFLHEIATVKSLEHDHILPVIDYGEYGFWCYLVMPYLKDGTLCARVNVEGPLTPEEAGKFLEQISGALSYAHKHGILHRDVKSSNILLRDRAYVYLADFGLAKEQAGGMALTMPGYVMGTPEYLAPELQFATTATPSSDLYALGVVLYEMLTGQLPFRESVDKTIRWQHLYKLPTPPSQLQPAISPAIDNVVLHALEKNPSRRFRTPEELNQAYQRTIHAPSHSQTTHEAILFSPLSHKASRSIRRPGLWRRFLNGLLSLP